jgi:hypothetical protein
MYSVQSDAEPIHLFVWYKEYRVIHFDFRGAFYINVTCAVLSGLFLTANSIDRVIAVRFPMAAPRLCTISRAKKVVVGSSVLIVILNLHSFYTWAYIKDPVTGKDN